MAKSVEDCLRKLAELEGRRYNWDSHWSEVAELVWPAADEFLTSRTPGEKRSATIFDATAALALEKFAAAMESMLTPRAMRVSSSTSPSKVSAFDMCNAMWAVCSSNSTRHARWIPSIASTP